MSDRSMETPARATEDTNTASQGPPLADALAKSPYLLIIAGSRVGELYRLSQARTVLGRSPHADVQIIDEGVSRMHAEFVVDGDVVTARDLESTNGTYCNGVRVGSHRLADGDKVSIGSTTILKFSYQDGVDVAYQVQLHRSAIRDGLTKALKKEHFLERLHEEVAFAVRHSVPLALIFLDLDRFKLVNDEHGHQAGDRVLAETARVIQELVRTEDVFARYGGEEFAVSCRSTPLVQAQSLAERLRRGVESSFVETEKGPLHVTASFGIAACPAGGITAAALIAAADEAMYRAKARGRNRVEVAGRHL